MRVAAIRLLALLVALPAAAQETQTDPQIDDTIRASVVERLTSKIQAGYLIPEAAQVAIRNLRAAQESGEYKEIPRRRRSRQDSPRICVLRQRTNILPVFFDPEPAVPPSSSTPPEQARERYNFGFAKIERLKGNVGYLDLRSFADLEQGRETASTYLDALANFDGIIIDLRQNGGGNTPMAGYIASYFFGAKPVHFTDMYWRDQNKTVEVWTSENVVGRRSERQLLSILVGPSTFSAAEDFAYSMQQLKRVTIVGERTGGGAHMGRGLQRLSPLFTAFIPVGESLNPVTKTNWENVGVQPDVKTPADKALFEAHLAALRGLAERETNPGWQGDLRRAIADVAAGK